MSIDHLSGTTWQDVGAVIVRADALRPGDIIVRQNGMADWPPEERDGLYVMDFVRVAVVRGPEVGTRKTGLWGTEDVIRFWCRREDTGDEGYMTYGAGGMAGLIACGLPRGG